MYLIRCSQCNSTNNLNCELSYRYSISHCYQCYQTKEQKSEWYFCDVGCMTKWMKEKEVEEKGFPCKYCNSTGFQCGIEKNGPCILCKGTQRLPKTIMEGFTPMEEINKGE